MLPASNSDMHKEAVVLRWGTSSLYMRLRILQARLPMTLVQETLSYLYKVEDPSAHPCHRGGFPVQVRNVEGIVGIVIIDRLGQDDHCVIVHGIQEDTSRTQLYLYVVRRDHLPVGWFSLFPVLYRKVATMKFEMVYVKENWVDDAL